MYGAILTAGMVDASLVPIFGQIPTGLIPVNGKPIIFFIIENFVKSGIKDIYIGVDYDSEYLKKIINIFFERKANLHFVEVDKRRGPGDSLLEIFKLLGSGSVIVNLADTLVPIDMEVIGNKNAVLISQEVDNPERWCLVETDADTMKIVSFREKEANVAPRNGAVGLYVFQDVEVYSEYLAASEKTQISDLISFAMREQDFIAVDAENWLDFGHIDKYQIAKKKMLASRVFNTLEFDDLLGTVTKRSTETSKFVEEIRWQLNLPPRISVLFPRILASNIHSHHPFITMEYYSYQSVAEIWLYSSFGVSGLLSIINRILQILSIFTEYPAPVTVESYAEVYIKKTTLRIDRLRNDSVLFDKLLNKESVCINEKWYRNWPSIQEEIFGKLDKLYENDKNCLIHGDFCFSNILYDVNGGIVRLIDPRGSWGRSIGGDIRYDVAKLRHSIVGLYDFIVNDLFIANMEEDIICYEIFSQPHHIEAGKIFDGLVAQKYDLEEIRLIEGILFLSMIPLHSDNQSRQIMMYCRAIELLNSVVTSAP